MSGFGVRVIAGRFGGRRLKSARAPGLRPTSDRVREAVFSVLGADVEGARVLDLYAGTGALGLEALSRGAVRACLVERDRRVAAVLEANVESLGVHDAATIVRADALDYCRRMDDSTDVFDVVFCDPPYAASLEPVWRVLAPAGWWTRVCAIEHAAAAAPRVAPLGRVLDTRRWGDTAVTFVRPA